ncbi:MAG: RNA-binding protein [Actinomycetota bacterium]|nr:RNA-binding protein [Actinomycetota bacterium]
MTAHGLLAHDTVASWRGWRARASTGGDGVRRAAAPREEYRLFTYAGAPLEGCPVLVALDDLAPTRAAALLGPADVLASRGVPTALLAPGGLADALAGRGVRPVASDGGGLREPIVPAVVLAMSHAVGAGAAAWQVARRAGACFMVVQHGVVTPYAPPLPAGGVLLAWSDSDAAFWIAGRDDVEVDVVGSELLWTARHSHVPREAAGDRVCFLGQLHGAELDREVTVRTVSEISRSREVLYRPHPAEQDAGSLLHHERWRRSGVTVGSAAVPLVEEEGPVVGIFSTGILEAAAGGLEAFAACVRPPAWVESLWSRYEMSPFGANEPTRVRVPATRPASRIADLVEARR